ncbi:PEP-CTERM sorting domain-containing protein [Chromatium okenii]|uniref:PEP-CTERM sorting domain-containing protein n=1 Tax=Chromatium okenii TaxID=61644 RepID=UPI00155929D3|nr:PEP-CTERM sorting domain-containing protein [Chromatium okenii]
MKIKPVRRKLISTLAITLGLSVTTVKATTIWDPVTEFSINNGNPNGVWSYGWMPTNFSSFNPYTNVRPTTPYPGWYRPGSSGEYLTPTIMRNDSGTQAWGVAPGQLTLHPGRSYEPSVLRWTAPANITGSVTIQGLFLAGDSGQMQVDVRRNGVEIWQAQDHGAFDLVANVVSGDTLDFAVYGGWAYGNTPLAALLTLSDTLLASTPPVTNTPLASAGPTSAAYVQGAQTLPGALSTSTCSGTAANTSVSSLELRAGSALTMYEGDKLTAPNGVFIDVGATLQGSGTITGEVINSGTIHILLPISCADLSSVSNITGNSIANFGTTYLGGGSGSSGSGGGSSGGSSGGYYAGDITNAGTISFERNFDGEFLLDGDFSQTASGQTIYDIAGYLQGTQYSYLHVTGAADLAGTFAVNLLDSFIPTDASTFDIFQADGGITFNPADFNLSMPTGFDWSVVDNSLIRLTYHGISDGAVSEPTTLALLGLGLLGGMAFRLSRKAA